MMGSIRLDINRLQCFTMAETLDLICIPPAHQTGHMLMVVFYLEFYGLIKPLKTTHPRGHFFFVCNIDGNHLHSPPRLLVQVVHLSQTQNLCWVQVKLDSNSKANRCINLSSLTYTHQEVRLGLVCVRTRALHLFYTFTHVVQFTHHEDVQHSLWSHSC